MCDCRCRCGRNRYYIARAQRVLILASLCVQCRCSALFTVGYCVDIVCMRTAVIRPALCRRRYAQCLCALRDCQCTNRFTDRIVCVGYAAPRDLIGVVNRAAHFRDCSGYLDAHAVTARQGYRHICSGRQRCARPAECRCTFLCQRITVIFLGVCARCNRQRRRRDAQRTKSISDSIVSRYTCNTSLFCFCQIIHRTICHMSNGRSIGQSRGDCGSICTQFTADSICSTQRYTVIGFTICFCCYSQR